MKDALKTPREESNTLSLVRSHLFDKLGFCCTTPIPEAECAHYDGHTFLLNEKAIRYRQAKITPTKAGQFVTLWKRRAKGTITPLDEHDELDFLLISCRKDTQLGQFAFPKSILLKKGILSSSGKEGKLAFRVYPPWESAPNNQATKTQQWQRDYFLEIPTNGTLDVGRAKTLFAIA